MYAVQTALVQHMQFDHCGGVSPHRGFCLISKKTSFDTKRISMLITLPSCCAEPYAAMLPVCVHKGNAKISWKYGATGCCRCHPQISRVPDTLFYNGRLLDGCSSAQRPALAPGLPPVCFLETQGAQQQYQKGSSSASNKAEAQAVVQVSPEVICQLHAYKASGTDIALQHCMLEFANVTLQV